MAKYKKGKLKGTETHADIFENLVGASGSARSKLKIKKKKDPETIRGLIISAKDAKKLKSKPPESKPVTKEVAEKLWDNVRQGTASPVEQSAAKFLNILQPNKYGVYRVVKYEDLKIMFP